MSRPTVAFVAHEVHDHGGMERAAAELIRRGSDRYRFVVVSSTLAEDLRPLVEWRRVRRPSRPAALRYSGFWVRAGRELRRVDADLVHVLGAIVPVQADLATVQFCHAGFRAATGRLSPPDGPAIRRVNTALARRLALAFEQRCYRPGKVGVLAAVSKGVAAELARYYPEVTVAVTPNGVDTDRFQPAAERSREGVVAVFVGGDWDRKGLGVAIEALSFAPGVTLQVVGRGDEHRFGALAEHYGVSDRIQFLGPRRDVELVLQESDVFVLPTLYEAFSLAMLEAAACGLPLTVTRINGAAELVGEDEAGILVERTPEAVGGALAALAADIPRRERLGAEARRRALGFGWERSVESVLELYDSLLAASASRAGIAA